MPYATLLTEPEIAEGLRQLPDWERDGGWITRTIRCPTFRSAIDLVDRVANVAEEANHHPDMEVSWRNVTFRLTTKAADGLTAKDLALAKAIDQLASDR
jgi:4a-hydroxytetrahydrobiopterin dehydratase